MKRKAGFIGLILIAIIGFGLYSASYHGTDEIITITVTDKERITESSGSGKDLQVTSKYLVFTENETFENTDNLIFGKFNSSDIQGKLKIGSTYKVKVAGWRLEYISSYRNIIEIK